MYKCIYINVKFEFLFTERTNQSRSEPTGNVSQEEQDRLLAMHLDQDLNEESNLQNMIREFDKPSLVQRGGNSSYMMDRNVTDSYDIEPDFTGLLKHTLQ